MKMSSYQDRQSHYEGKKVKTLSYLHSGNSYTGKTTSATPGSAPFYIPDGHSQFWKTQACMDIIKAGYDPAMPGI